MTRLAARLLRASLALTLAIPSGAFALTAFVLVDPDTRHEIGRIGLDGVVDIASGLPPDILFAAAADFLHALALQLILPPLIAAVMGALLCWRAWSWYAGSSGLISARLGAIPASRLHEMHGSYAFVSQGRVFAALLLAGALAGFVYWAVEGASAPGVGSAGD